MGRWNKKGAPGSFRVHRAPHTHSRCTERVPSVLRPRQPRRAAPDHRITSTSAAKMFGWLKGSGKTPAARRQELRDAAKLPKGTTTEARSPVKRRNTAPAFSREQCRRDRAMMSSSFRRRMTWQQSLCVKI